jgi:pheromone shutdown-related protein TraB
MTKGEFNEPVYSKDVKRIKNEDREYVIVGTAHISKQSAELVKEVIENENPDIVCVELDEKRYKALSEKNKWESLDLKEVIRTKQLSTLLINILLGSYQKRMGEKLGVSPGLELVEATKVAKENDIPISLVDREVRITLRRAWNSMSFWQKMKFLTVGLAGIFEKEEITEEKLDELKDKDILSEMMQELGKAMPVLKKVLIDERDGYLAQKIMSSEGRKVVAVVGAGHVEGICDAIEEARIIDLKEIEIIPPTSNTTKIIGWSIPVIIIGSLVYIGMTKGSDAAGDNLIFWILANGIPSALGVVLALGHPLTVLSAFLAAPITSLTPVIGAGYVAAFVQLLVAPPIVKDFDSVSNDVAKFKTWWSNRILKILLVFILSGLGSAIGTYVGAYEIIKNIF